MPNAPVQAAATGLPAIRPKLATIMRRAHAEAREASPRLPYAERFKLALRRAWREARAAVRDHIRSIVEDQIEAMIALLDHLDPDPDLEPSLGYYFSIRYEPDAKMDEDDDDQCDDEDNGDREPSGGGGQCGEDDPDFPDVPGRREEAVMVREASSRLRSIIRGQDAMAVRS